MNIDNKHNIRPTILKKIVSVSPNNVNGEIRIIKIEDPKIGARKVSSATFLNITLK